jgi:hypothetical protein
VAALKLRKKHFVIDGEAFVLDEDGVSDFDALASRKHDKPEYEQATPATIYSARPAMGLEGIVSNASIALMAPASAPSGSKSRTPRTQPTTG